MAEFERNPVEGKITSSGNVLRLVATGPKKRPRGRAKQNAKYDYPKSLLTQEYFDRSGDGTWHEPRFNYQVLGDKKFASPLGALLDQMEAEGHNVTGARIEWLAFRDLARYYSDLFREMAACPKSSALATELYRSSDK